MKISPLDLMMAIIEGKSGAGAQSFVGAIVDNKELLMVFSTSVAVIVGCVLVLTWRRSFAGQQKARKGIEPPKAPVVKLEPAEEVDDGKKKVAVFFGTQTGTAEGFAKV